MKADDLKHRTKVFALRIIKLVESLPPSRVADVIGRQLVRCGTSVGANYIEANEALGKRDFLMRIRICRKEAKESGYWLKLVEAGDPDLRKEQELLLRESTELMKIFGSILTKSQ